jgi:DNA-binding transcriptional regulator YbjK
MSTERRTLIADTAIELMAELGARGLTHRAVDAKAGMPNGSTSAYCRTRADLLALVAARHAALDLADMQRDASKWSGRALTLEGFLDALLARITDWLSRPKRNRLVARIELFLIASREPELAQVVEAQRKLFENATSAALQLIGVPDPALVTPALMMVVDAILFGQVGHHAPPFSAEQCRMLLRQVVLMSGPIPQRSAP